MCPACLFFLTVHENIICAFKYFFDIKIHVKVQLSISSPVIKTYAHYLFVTIFPYIYRYFSFSIHKNFVNDSFL